MEDTPPGYNVRNLYVSKAHRLNVGLCNIKDRMTAREDCPVWFIRQMNDMIDKSNCLIRPLVQHRDELPKV